MPIHKVPLVHRFGVISLSEAERIIRQRRLQEHRATSKTFTNKSTSCPVITVEFIAKYNSCSELERGKLDGVLKRVLEHAKYKSHHGNETSPPKSNGGGGGGRSDSKGSKSDRGFGKGGVSDLDVSEGWLELIMMCQCCGPLQEESLLSLCSSLSLSPVSPVHVPALFYISGLCYYWLKTETAPSVLRSGELLLLKVLHRVSLRLYLHHLTSELQDVCSPNEVQQLKFDLDGFEKCEKTYRSFPEALLHWRVALDVGSLICDKYIGRQSTPLLSLPEEWSEEGGGSTGGPTTPTTTDNVTKSCSITSASSSNGGHCLSPILWHALDVWQCNQLEPSAMPDAIEDLLSCNISFNTQHWLEGLLAIEVLCNTAQSNVEVLRLVQSLAAGNFKAFASTSPLKQPSSETTSSKTKVPSLSQYLDKSDEESSKTNAASVVSENKMYSSNTRKAKKVTTLNILGVQPTFAEPDTESEFTSYTAMDDDKEEEVNDDSEYDNDYEDEFADEESSNKRAHGYSSVSVATQALIDTESIPDTLLTTHSSDCDSLELSELKITSTIDGDYSGYLDSSTAKDSSGLVDTTETDIGGSEKLPVQKKTGTQKKVTLISLPQSPMYPVSDMELSSSDHESTHESAINRVELLDDRFELISVLKHQQVNEQGTKSVTLAIPSPHRADSRCTHFTHSTAPFSWVGGGVLGSQAAPSTVYQQSILSLSQSIGSDEATSSEGKISSQCFNVWPMEVQLAYVLNMGDVVVNGIDSSIQKMALLGPDEYSVTAQYSLVKLSGYENLTESRKSQVEQSWYVRHCVILGLSRICHSCKDRPTQDGMSEISWNTLQKRMSLELEPKVLEAHKLHQSCSVKLPSSPRSLSLGLPVTLPPSIIAHMAEELANLFLPDITYKFSTNDKKSSPKIAKPPKLESRPQGSIIDKTKIKAKVKSQPCSQPSQAKPQSYIARTTCALNKIAEKHWELHMRLEDEEEEKRIQH